jgi:hypothetical protein
MAMGKWVLTLGEEVSLTCIAFHLGGHSGDSMCHMHILLPAELSSDSPVSVRG